MYYCGMNLITKNNFLSNDMKLKLLDIYLDEMKNTHVGQAWDIQWHGYLESIDEIPNE